MKTRKNAAKLALGYYRPEGESAIGLSLMVCDSGANSGLTLAPFVRPTDPAFRLLLSAGLELRPLHGCTAPAPNLLDYNR